MHVIHANNVNDAFHQGMQFFKDLQDNGEPPMPSRNGDVLRALTPVATVYANPCERVLFDEARNANPFFHYIEAMWMLAGGNTLTIPQFFNSRFTEYSDDGETLNGAYGFRWRDEFGHDQINLAVKMLMHNIYDRRVVIGMWNPFRDLGSASVDVPCNLSIKLMFNRNEEALDMVVFNRSNDMIWGAYGANAVHMSMLQEHIALAVGVNVGTYTQVSADFHAYLNVFEPMLAKWSRRSVVQDDPYSPLHRSFNPSSLHGEGHVEFHRFRFHLREAMLEMEKAIGSPAFKPAQVVVDSSAPQSIQDAQHMYNAYAIFRGERDYKAIHGHLMNVHANDWRYACTTWMMRQAAKAGL